MQAKLFKPVVNKFFIGDIMAILSGFDVSQDSYCGALKLARYLQNGVRDAAMSTSKPFLERLFPKLADVATLDDNCPSLLHFISTIPKSEHFLIIDKQPLWKEAVDETIERHAEKSINDIAYYIRCLATFNFHGSMGDKELIAEEAAKLSKMQGATALAELAYYIEEDDLSEAKRLAQKAMDVYPKAAHDHIVYHMFQKLCVSSDACARM